MKLVLMKTAHVVVVNSGEDDPTTGSTGAAQRKQDNVKKRRRKYSKVDRKPTNNLTWLHRIVRTFKGEERRNFIKTLRNTIRITYTLR